MLYPAQRPSAQSRCMTCRAGFIQLCPGWPWRDDLATYHRCAVAASLEQPGLKIVRSCRRHRFTRAGSVGRNQFCHAEPVLASKDPPGLLLALLPPSHRPREPGRLWRLHMRGLASLELSLQLTSFQDDHQTLGDMASLSPPGPSSDLYTCKNGTPPWLQPRFQCSSTHVSSFPPIVSGVVQTLRCIWP